MATLKVGLTFTAARKPSDTPMDYTYVVERIRRIAPHQYIVEVRSERQRCFDRLVTGYTTWTSGAMVDGFKAGTLQEVS